MGLRRRNIGDLMGVYRRDGRLRLGRSPYISDEQWRHIEHPTLGLRLLQRLGLAYTPDHTRPRLFRHDRTTD